MIFIKNQNPADYGLLCERGRGVYFGKTKCFRRIICVRGSFRHEMMKKFVVIVRMSAISIIMMRVVLSACVLITFGCEMKHYGVLHRKMLSFCCKRQKINGFAEMLDNIYIYIYIMRCAKQRKCAAWHIFTFGRNKKCVSFLTRTRSSLLSHGTTPRSWMK